ncbi:MAG: TVP38/TMEM64 family protein [Candidatus Krumholzibacteriota bacterium]|nr:TVP38/TMEM64 family protein [Candidatus Krumholzibacteriota bacterium]
MQVSGTDTRFPLAAVLRAAILPLLVLASLLVLRRLGIDTDLDGIRRWVAARGAWSDLAFVALYALTVLAALPGMVMTLAGGVLFGSLEGVVLVSIGSALGASLAFWLARGLAREAVQNWLGGNRHFQRLDRWTDERGAVVVALTRLFPVIPFNILNFAFGLTRVRFGIYLLWTWLCMLPGTVVYVVGVDAILLGRSEGQVPWPLVWVAAGALLLLLGLLPWARRCLRRHRAGED